MMVRKEEVTIPAAHDSFPLSATVFIPSDVDGGSLPAGGESKAYANKPVVIVSAATGVLQGFYHAFCSFLARRGCVAVTYDYRGIGKSIPKSGLKHFHAHIYTHWALRDLVGVMHYVCKRFSERPICAVGNSVGAHIVPMLPYNWRRRLLRCVFVGANSAYWRFGKSPFMIFLFAYLMGNCAPYLYGYFPAKRLGICEDLPTGVGGEWGFWSRSADYNCAQPGFRRVANAYNIPTLNLNFSDDDFATRRSFQSWSRHLGASVDHRFVDTPTLGKLALRQGWWSPQGSSSTRYKIGHMGFFRREHETVLWETCARFLCAGTPADTDLFPRCPPDLSQFPNTGLIVDTEVSQLRSAL